MRNQTIESDSAAACPPDTNAQRRQLLSALLGAVGVTSLVGCEQGAGSPTTAAIASALYDGSIKSAVSANELRSQSGTAGCVAVLLGYYTAGDGGGGIFYWDTSTAADDGGTRLNNKKAASAGWQRVYDGALNVRWFGAKGSGSDDRGAIQAAINVAAIKGRSVFCPAGTYLIAGKTAGSRSPTEDGLSITASNIELFGEGDATVLKQGDDSQYVLYVNRGGVGTDPANLVKNLKVHNIRFQGPNNRSDPSANKNQWVHLLNTGAISNLIIERCSFIGFQGDGICLGSGDSGGVHPHNIDVIVRSCLFDGIDNQNRNGISVIDVDGLLIEGNRFMNCSSLKMPGCVDIEPDTAHNHVRNIRIIDNYFSGCNGVSGNICIVLRAAELSLQPSNFTIIGNQFDGNVGVCFINGQTPYSGDAPYNVLIKGNVGTTLSFVRVIGYARGLTIANNVITAAGALELGVSAGDKVADCVVLGNTLHAQGSINMLAALNVVNLVVSSNSLQGNDTGAGLVVKNGSNISITNNILSGFKNRAMFFGDTTGMLSQVSVNGNIFSSISGAGYSAQATSTVDGASCIYINNVHTGNHSFPAWRTDAPGALAAGAHGTSYSASTLPDDFPVGVHTSLLNGDHALPVEGGWQGTLVTYRGSNEPGYEKWTHQFFYHANNTTSLGTFYLRRRDHTANKWTPWYKVTGV